MGIYLGVYAQTDIFAGYNSTHSGRSVTLVVSKTIKNRHEFGGGLRFNINRLQLPDDQMNIYLKRLYATKPIHYFGLQAFYHVYFLNKLKYIKPFVFYDLQATYSTTRLKYLMSVGYDTNGHEIIKEFVDYNGPFTWVEQNVGVGFKVNIYNNFFFHEKVGFGIAYIFDFGNKIAGNYRTRFNWEFCPLFNVGIGYRFEKKEKK